MADFKKQGRANRTKGMVFERKVATMLGEALEMKLRRTPLSGGWAEKEIGDVIPDDMAEYKKFPFYVECRNRKNWSWKQIFNAEGPVFDWYEETLSKACTVSKSPVLVFTKPYEDTYVMVPDKADTLQKKLSVYMCIPEDDIQSILITTLDTFCDDIVEPITRREMNEADERPETEQGGDGEADSGGETVSRN